MNPSRLYTTDDCNEMKTALLQFNSLAELAAFWKQVNDRGFVMVIKDLTLKCNLTDAELAQVQQNGGRQLPVARAAA
jgi:hypothetical protein